MKRVLALCLGVVVLLSACVKKSDEVIPDAHVRFVNAVSGSADQEIYVNNIKITGSRIAFTQQTPYYTYLSGINRIDFADAGSNTINATISYGSDANEFASVFFYRNATGLVVGGAVKDDMTAPPAGKARVRFLHLNYLLTNPLKIGVVGGTDLVSNINFGSSSAYYNVDPGTKFVPVANGLVTAPEINFNLQAGKIYTIWLNGTTATELFANGIVQN